jgi:hypothetical protein
VIGASEYRGSGYRVSVDDETGAWRIYLCARLLGCLSEQDRAGIFDGSSYEEMEQSLNEWVLSTLLAHARPICELLIEVAGEQGR